VIRNGKTLEKFERELAKRGRLSIEKKFEILKGMVEYARSLGLWPPKDPLEGIEKDIKLAEVLRGYGRYGNTLKMEEENDT